MTTINEARKAIYQRFKDNWTGTTPFSSTVTFANEAYDPPPDQPNIRLTVNNLASGQETLGKPTNRRFNREGLTIIEIRVPVNTGLTIADSLADEARTIFEATGFEGINFFSADTAEIGPNGQFYRVDVIARFEYYERK